MPSMGACLLANEPAGIGEAMIEARVQGKSWKQIADEFNLPNPGAARKAFTKYTGLTDYKTKGQAVKQVFQDMIDGGKAASNTVVKEGVKAVDDALSNKPVFEVVNDAMKAGKNDTVGGKLLSNQEILDKTGLTNEQLVKIVDLHEKKIGYMQIKSQVPGTTTEQIDQAVWNHLLKKHEGRVWEAYLEKPTSQSGFDAVKERVFDLRNKGLTVKDIIANETAPPESVVDAILKGTWSMPGPGATAPIIPPPPPEVFTGALPSGGGTNFERKTHEEMMGWIDGLGSDLTPESRSAIQGYTGSNYRTINDGLRGGGGHSSTRVRNIDAGMRPIPFDTVVTRNVSGTHVFGGQPMESLVGTVFRDRGYLSTTITESGVFSGNVQMVISVPRGTSARYVANISSFPSEREMIIGRDTKMVVTRVEKHPVYGSTRWIVYLEVIA